MAGRRIVHLEIPMQDRRVTTDFYRELCGWSFTTDEQFAYTMFETGNIGGGLSPLSETVNSNDVLVYIESNDVQADVKHVERLGGTVMVPYMEVPGMGYLAIWKDPIGNMMAFWQDVNPG